MNQNPVQGRPAVIIWYKIYCVLMAIGYFMFSFYIAFLIWLPKDSIIKHGPTAGWIVTRLENMWGGLLAGSISITILFVVALFLPKKPWVWIYGIIAICIGIPNCCCFPLTVPVLIVWINRETKQYFGYG